MSGSPTGICGSKFTRHWPSKGGLTASQVLYRAPLKALELGIISAGTNYIPVFALSSQTRKVGNIN